MAKQKDEKTNVMRILDQKEIPYTPHTYPHEEGEAVDVLPVDMTERKHRVELKSKKENFAESIPMV